MHPQEPPPGPDRETQRAIEKIAKVLGVDASDEQAIRDAFEALFAPVEEARSRARLTMSKKELANCRVKGVDPAAYVHMRDSIRARSAHGRRSSR